MAGCIWIQYEPAGSTTPYEGFINSTVSGTDDTEPPLALPRLQFSVPLGTLTAGMMVDVIQLILVTDPELQ